MYPIVPIEKVRRNKRTKENIWYNYFSLSISQCWRSTCHFIQIDNRIKVAMNMISSNIWFSCCPRILTAEHMHVQLFIHGIRTLTIDIYYRVLIEITHHLIQYSRLSSLLWWVSLSTSKIDVKQKRCNLATPSLFLLYNSYSTLLHAIRNKSKCSTGVSEYVFHLSSMVMINDRLFYTITFNSKNFLMR
jgi:hypothetical protein